MKFFVFMFLLISTRAFALDAVIVVLEAPYFREPNINSDVVQYARKGDIINVHPSVNNTDKYNHLAPEQRKLSIIRKKLKNSPGWNEDPMFKGDEDDTYTIDDDFIAVLDRQGKKAYVKKEHIYVYFNDTREFAQEPFRLDETDYRLEEPLPKRYPLPNKTGYRGMLVAGLTQPNTESYPYLKPIRTKGYASPVDISLIIMKEAGEKKVDRFYFGAIGNIRSFKNSFSFGDDSLSSEENFRFGVGPYISYDAYKGVQNRIAIYSAVNVYLWNKSQIVQTLSNGDQDSREYKAYTFSPKVGFQYHRKGIFPDLDFVLGTALEVEPPATYKAQNGAKQSGIWRSAGDDSFRTRFAFNLGAYLGIQSAY